MPSTSAVGRSLWDSSEGWSEAFENYTEAIEKYGSEGLLEMDRWFSKELPQELQRHEKGKKALAKEDLVKIMEWKLKRGRWRPKLLEYAKAAAAEEVRNASSTAFSALEGAPSESEEEYEQKCLAALKPLMRIKGLGPATASAIMSAADPQFPFMSDEGMDACLQKKPAYTVKRYVEYAVAMRRKAKQLSSKGKTWAPKDVERAIYSVAINEQGKIKGPKRKRED